MRIELATLITIVGMALVTYATRAGARGAGAARPTAVIAARTNNLLLAIIGGVGAVWLLRAYA